jgi:hypothetical protein
MLAIILLIFTILAPFVEGFSRGIWCNFSGVRKHPLKRSASGSINKIIYGD